MDYEAGLRQLLQRLDPQSQAYLDVLTLQQRLQDNVRNERLFGSSESIRSERAGIVYALNSLALSVLTVSFNDLATGAASSAPDRGSGALLTSDSQVSLWHLQDALTSHFNAEELRTLCFDLGVDWENLGGPGLPLKNKAIDLVEYMRQRNRLDELRTALRATRRRAL